LSSTIEKVETATRDALQNSKAKLPMESKPEPNHPDASPIFSPEIGYVQRIDVSELQSAAEKFDLQINVQVLPGTFLSPDQPLALVSYPKHTSEKDIDSGIIVNSFTIGRDRIYDEDPRFGFLTLSEIGSRALSPAVNDPGTAIYIIDAYVRLFTNWSKAENDQQDEKLAHDRVVIPDISLDELFDDAFNTIARDGAGIIEVAQRLQKAFKSLSSLSNEAMVEVSIDHAHLAFRYAEEALSLPEEIKQLREIYNQ
jgi:uncharacterized membrane protein